MSRHFKKKAKTHISGTVELNSFVNSERFSDESVVSGKEVVSVFVYECVSVFVCVSG